MSDSTIHINNSCGGNAEIFVGFGNKYSPPSTHSSKSKARLRKLNRTYRRKGSLKEDSCKKSVENCEDLENEIETSLKGNESSKSSEDIPKKMGNPKVQITNSCRGNAKIIVQLEGLLDGRNPEQGNSSSEGKAGLAKQKKKHRSNGKKSKNKKVDEFSKDLKTSTSNEPLEKSKEHLNITEVCCVCLTHQARDDLKVCRNFHYICKLCYSLQLDWPRECLVCKAKMDEPEYLSDDSEYDVKKNTHLKHYCPVCGNLIKSKARYCFNLHLVCNRCFLQIIESDECPNVCPTCRCDYPDDNLCNLLEESLKSSTRSS